MISKTAAFPVTLAIAATLTACGGDTASTADGSGEYPMTVQNCGEDLTFEQQPQNVYVIGGEAGTLVHAAGAVDRIGTFSPLTGEPLGDAADALAAPEQAPIQTATDISREVIIGAQPDLVVAFGLGDVSPDDLAAAGIPTYIIAGYCGGFGAGQSEVQDPLQGVYDDVRTLGQILGTVDIADQAADDLEARVDAVRADAEQNPPADTATAALFVAGPDSALGAYGGRSMIHQQLSTAGLTNLFADTDERYFEPNTETIIGSAPQRLIALYEPGDTGEDEVSAALTGRPELASIPAVINDDILVLDFFYSGHGTLAVDGLEQLADQLRG